MFTKQPSSRVLRRAAGFAALVIVAAACGSDEPSSALDESTSSTSQPATTSSAAPVDETTTTEPEPEPALELDLELPPLVDGSLYEAWLIIDDEPVSVGTFDLAEGPQIALPVSDDLTAANVVVITIETDDDPAPSDSKVLAGDLAAGTAELTVGHPAALGTDFAEASGEYILATPTDGTGSDENERSGIWWTFIPRAQSLVLPELPDGWTYEGWQIIDGVPVTSGTFRESFGVADDAAPYSGPTPGPPLPGEDYLTNAPEGLEFPRDLRGTEVVISIEPVPDNSPGPYPLVPLRGLVPDDAVDHVSYSVDNVAAALPTGSASIG